jgi:hypothetical protein
VRPSQVSKECSIEAVSSGPQEWLEEILQDAARAHGLQVRTRESTAPPLITQSWCYLGRLRRSPFCRRAHRSNRALACPASPIDAVGNAILLRDAMRTGGSSDTREQVGRAGCPCSGAILARQGSRDEAHATPADSKANTRRQDGECRRMATCSRTTTTSALSLNRALFCGSWIAASPRSDASTFAPSGQQALKRQDLPTLPFAPEDNLWASSRPGNHHQETGGRRGVPTDDEFLRSLVGSKEAAKVRETYHDDSSYYKP